MKDYQKASLVTISLIFCLCFLALTAGCASTSSSIYNGCYDPTYQEHFEC